MSDKTKAMWSDRELAKCEPEGKRVAGVAVELGRFLKSCKDLGGLITANQAATILGLSHERVRQLGQQGVLRTRNHLGRLYYSVADVDARMIEMMDDSAARRGGVGSDLRKVWRSSLKEGQRA